MVQQQFRKTVVNCHPTLDIKFSGTSPQKAMLPFILSLSILIVHIWVSTAQPTVIIFNATSSVYFQNVSNGAFFLNSSSPSSWSNNNSINRTISSGDSLTVRLLLNQGSSDLGYGCGFFCNGSCDSYYLSVVIGSFYGRGSYQQSRIPKVVWTANRDRPVRENATLELTQDGDLILHDSDHTKVWSTDTAGMSVAGMNVTTQGNLVLFDERGAVVWQSFDHPTDALLFGQELYEGQRLNASISAVNLSSGSYYYALMTSFGFAAFVQVEADTPLMYFQVVLERSRRNSRGPISTTLTSFPGAFPPFGDYPQYIKLGSDGHLRFYQWASEGWREQSDLVVKVIDECQYPHSCGEYGVCNEGQCSCPEGIDGVGYFKRIQSQLPNQGCSRITPLSCEASSDKHHLVDFGNLSYFNLIDQNASVPKLNDVDRCKQACLQNCSCEAAFFKHGDNFSDGYCYLISRVLSIRAKPIPGYNFSSSAFIKVRSPYLAPSPEPISRSTPESPLPPTSRKQTNLAAIIAGSAVGTVVMIFLLVALCVLVSRKKNVEEGDEYFNLVPGMPMKFSYEDLRIATEDFKERLGRGGFGSVFKGTLEDGMGIAVKRLDNVGQGVKEFLAEVETIGSIHHINLVRLVGFCVEKSHRLLVYEHMSNGSLDNWIFNKNQNPTLDWQTRKKIILNVAKGLAYLHEECRQRIVHLDIKPQNILLDDNFNAKVSDFGLSKLIDGDQSQVLTNMRGTPGYLAPEWHQLRITVKADIYSFGIVVLEIVCGRRNFDHSRAESSAHLLGLLEKKAEEDQLIDIVDEMSEDMRLHGEEVMKMIRTAAWCLQDDHTRRPLMSVVVKVLEGVMEVDPDISYRFSNAVAHPVETGVPVSSAPPQATILSGPR